MKIASFKLIHSFYTKNMKTAKKYLLIFIMVFSIILKYEQQLL